MTLQCLSSFRVSFSHVHGCIAWLDACTAMFEDAHYPTDGEACIQSSILSSRSGLGVVSALDLISITSSRVGLTICLG